MEEFSFNYNEVIILYYFQGLEFILVQAALLYEAYFTFSKSDKDSNSINFAVKLKDCVQ